MMEEKNSFKIDSNLKKEDEYENEENYNNSNNHKKLQEIVETLSPSKKSFCFFKLFFSCKIKLNQKV